MEYGIEIDDAFYSHSHGFAFKSQYLYFHSILSQSIIDVENKMDTIKLLKTGITVFVLPFIIVEGSYSDNGRVIKFIVL